MISKTKTYTIADPQLISGSGDPFRDVLDPLWAPSSETSSGTDLGDLGSSDRSSRSEPISPATDPTLKKVWTSDPEISLNGILNTYEYAYRLVGNEELVLSDKYWKSYIVGGEFSEQTMPGIYVNASFADHYHTEEIPYSVMETKQNGSSNTSSPLVISAVPQLNSYFSRYEEYINNFDSIREIPNVYKVLQNAGIRTKEQIKEDLNFNFPNGEYKIEQTPSLMQNILVSKPEIYGQIEDLNNDIHIMPQSVAFEFDFGDTGQFVETCVENDFSNRFIKILKDSFLGEDGATATLDVDFSLKTKSLGATGIEETSQITSLKAVDVPMMLDYSLRDYNTEAANFEYLLDSSEEASSQYDNKSIRRFGKTIPTIKQTNSIIEYLNSSIYTETFINNPINTNEKNNEIVAYRIEKIGGDPTGDSDTQTALQNFWFLNIKDVKEFQYYDNQVAYGQKYTYNIYKYVLVSGINYVYSGIRVSRVIAELGVSWCLEIYNPDTDEPIAPLFESEQISDDNVLASDAQINSLNKYVADFRLSVSPSIKIVEVPLMTKDITMLDAPTNPVGIQPFYVMDNSQQIGFRVRYEPPISKKFPTPLNDIETTYRNSYLLSNDLLEDDAVLLESVSLPTTLEVFRILDKPNSLTEFNGNLIATKNIKIVNHEASFSTTTLMDKVAINKKYFYLLRIVNEVGSPAYPSVVIEAELVSDGGYKFAEFEAYFEEELGEKVFSKPSKEIKKLINIIPNIKNIIVDETAADFSKRAVEELGNIRFGADDDLVWNKTFKLRLTSKKTGKKIDINLTYKLDGQ